MKNYTLEELEELIEEIKKQSIIDYTELDILKFNENDKKLWQTVNELKQHFNPKQYDEIAHIVYKKWWKNKLKEVKEYKRNKRKNSQLH